MPEFLDYIIPIIVFVVWLLGQIGGALFNKSEQDQDRENRPFTPLNDPANDDDERTRRIQEEIRRKIAERRGEGRQQAPEGPPPVRRELPPSAEGPPPLHRRSGGEEWAPAHRFAPDPGLSESARDLAAELAEQSRRREETERQAAEARQVARAQMQRAFGGGIGENTSRGPRRRLVGGSLARRVKDRLADPQDAREAIIYGEVLGTPIGQRRPGEMRASWER